MGEGNAKTSLNRRQVLAAAGSAGLLTTGAEVAAKWGNAFLRRHRG